jgi:cilia- and flagella-associated protein 65
MTIYPKLITLSPGTSFNLPVTFKPLEKINYEDWIEFVFQEMNVEFRVPIRGFIPQYNIQVQDSIDLGMCTTFETVTHEIQIANTRYSFQLHL